MEEGEGGGGSDCGARRMSEADGSHGARVFSRCGQDAAYQLVARRVVGVEGSLTGVRW